MKKKNEFSRNSVTKFQFQIWTVGVHRETNFYRQSRVVFEYFRLSSFEKRHHADDIGNVKLTVTEPLNELCAQKKIKVCCA